MANRIMVLTSTTGTGAVTLQSTGVRDPVNGDCLAPAEVLSEIGNRLVPYFITSGGNFCYGKGVVSADGLTLERDSAELSWNGTVYAPGRLALTGTSTVMITPGDNELSSGNLGQTLAVVRGAVLS